jgi:hypothetical protein
LSPLRIAYCAVLFLAFSSSVVSAYAQGVVPLTDPRIERAIAAVKANEPHFIDEQVRICEIASPPFHEDVRAAELTRLFIEAGLKDVRISCRDERTCDALGEPAEGPRHWR